MGNNQVTSHGMISNMSFGQKRQLSFMQQCKSFTPKPSYSSSFDNYTPISYKPIQYQPIKWSPPKPRKKCLKILDNNNKNEIEVDSYHLSCKSSGGPYLGQKVNEYAGLIVYSIGTYDAKGRTGNNIYPGYVLLKKTKQIEKIDSNQGIVHGKLCKSFFKEEPSTMTKKYGAVFSGFAIQDGKLKINSFTFNTGTGYHDSDRKMNPIEIELLENFLMVCQTTKTVKTITLKQMDKTFLLLAALYK